MSWFALSWRCLVLSAEKICLTSDCMYVASFVSDRNCIAGSPLVTQPTCIVEFINQLQGMKPSKRLFVKINCTPFATFTQTNRPNKLPMQGSPDRMLMYHSGMGGVAQWIADTRIHDQRNVRIRLCRWVGR